MSIKPAYARMVERGWVVVVGVANKDNHVHVHNKVDLEVGVTR